MARESEPAELAGAGEGGAPARAVTDAAGSDQAADAAGSDRAADAAGSDRAADAAGSDRAADESLTTLLGGWRSAVETAVPLAGFAIGWLAGAHSIPWGAGIAVLAGAMVAGWRLAERRRPVGTVLSLLVVCAGALVALRTGRAEDFFGVRVLTNAVSALAWAASILVRWPFLGLIVGTVLGQKTRWRSDRALLRAYQRASWVWVLQYVIRLAVFIPLYAAGAVLWLAAAQTILTWPLVAACLAVSWWVLRRALPAEHPGIRHPVSSGPIPRAAQTLDRPDEPS
ncbi:DUF3159 domain-containing protein [Dactylosporangium sp. CA-139114]|uniref:DUF3159 domain-containing protein n=1 Tax=Dactylosporangium sp. CA-139114 TaxID=3239931 RepID=UPI003D974DEF